MSIPILNELLCMNVCTPNSFLFFNHGWDLPILLYIPTLDKDIDLNQILEQMYDTDNDIPSINSEYFEIDELKLMTGNTNFHSCEISCFHMNIRSLPNKINKLEILLNDLNNDNIHIDFLLLCETFLNNTNHDMYNLDGYKFVGKHRQIVKCGGVGIFIKNSISFKIRNDLSIFIEHEFESIFIEVSFGNKHVVMLLFRDIMILLLEYKMKTNLWSLVRIKILIYWT